MTGCGPRDGRYNPSNFQVRGALAPPDVVLPARGPGPIGLSVARGDSSLCCFIAPHATLLVRKTGPADDLRINVYVPDAAIFRRTPQTLRITFPGGEVRTIGGLTPGQHTNGVPLPKSVRGLVGTVKIGLTSSIEYVPEGGGDAQHYALVLVSIFFQ